MKRTNNDNSQWICFICKNDFGIKDLILNPDYKKHHTPQYICKYCDAMGFTLKGALSAHGGRHTNAMTKEEFVAFYNKTTLPENLKRCNNYNITVRK